MTETAMPVCRQGLLAEPTGVDVAKALGEARLIVSGHFPDEWAEWASARGIEPPDVSGALRLDSQEQVLAAAEEGLGLAIGRSPLVDERLRRGALIAPFGIPDPSDAGYHLLRHPGSPPTAAARRVAEWLRSVAED